MINRLTSYVKAVAICFSNWLTITFEPYQPFIRAADVKDPAPLHDKAARFQIDISNRFRIRNGEIITYRLPLPLGSPLDLGDQAIWHGIYTASEAFNVALGADPELLTPLLRGLESHQPRGMLVRGIDESGKRLYDASNDSACGHLAGLYYAWKYGTAEHKQTAANLISAWTYHIIAGGYALTDSDDKPTTFGQLVSGWKSDPLRASLLLAILRAAAAMTGTATFGIKAMEINNQYGPMIAFPKARLFTYDAHGDTHRAAIQLSILADINPNDQSYKRGLRRLMSLGRKQGNIWVLTLAGQHVGYLRGDRELAIKVLSEFSFDDKVFNPTRILSADKTIPQKVYGGEPVAFQPVVKWRKTAQDFDWQRHPYALDGRGLAGNPPDSALNGGDFLAAYRLCRVSGLLNAED